MCTVRVAVWCGVFVFDGEKLLHDQLRISLFFFRAHARHQMGPPPRHTLFAPETCIEHHSLAAAATLTLPSIHTFTQARDTTSRRSFIACAKKKRFPFVGSQAPTVSPTPRARGNEQVATLCELCEHPARACLVVCPARVTVSVYSAGAADASAFVRHMLEKLFTIVRTDGDGRASHPQNAVCAGRIAQFTQHHSTHTTHTPRQKKHSHFCVTHISGAEEKWKTPKRKK